jgi:hypothetical protein
MTMQTDRLIAALAADADTTPRRIGPMLALALLAALPVSVALFMSILGMRPDVRTAMHNPFFDLKFMVTLALAFAAIVVSLHHANASRWTRSSVALLRHRVVVVALPDMGRLAENGTSGAPECRRCPLKSLIGG